MFGAFCFVPLPVDCAQYSAQLGRDCIYTLACVPAVLFSLVVATFDNILNRPGNPSGRAAEVDSRLDVDRYPARLKTRVLASGGAYFGCMRIAPSTRIVSPLTYAFS